MSSRDYSAEPWIKVYVRQTPRDHMLSWQARAVLAEFRLQCDPAGIVETSDGTIGLAATLRYIPLDVVEAAVIELVKSGHLEILPGATGYLDPEHYDAQKKRAKPDALVQAEWRERRRAKARREGLGRKDSQPPVSNPDTSAGNPDEVSMREKKREEKKRTEKRGSAASPRKPKPSLVGVPADWKPTESHRALAAERGVDLDRAITRFRNHHVETIFTGYAALNGRVSNWLDNEKPTSGKTANVGQVAASNNIERATGEVAI